MMDDIPPLIRMWCDSHNENEVSTREDVEQILNRLKNVGGLSEIDIEEYLKDYN